MAILSSYKFSFALVAITIAIFLGNATCSTSRGVPAISASPAVLPYVTAPNMSSFFPSHQPAAAPAPAPEPESEAFAPVPSSGEFVGRVSFAQSNNPKGFSLALHCIMGFFVMILRLN
ncbi:hypothetical protein G4B88_018660 [Cannabis sativa]|uniref:Uncharacterized protein n=1 Tax=Cannabis sativa TaxID=3483 RepID=A0A7J6DK46_CANSA|nr:hypothetical protein G4B88_018660 [Cannabis sativa]